MLSVNPWPHLASQLVNRDGKDQQIPLKDAIDAITTHAPACSLNLAVRDAFRATLADDRPARIGSEFNPIGIGV